MHCNLCCGNSLGPFLPAYIRAVGFAEELGLVKCARCGLVFLHPQPSWEKLEQFYPESYYLEDSKTNNGFLSRLMERLESKNRGTIVVPGGRLLDVGCGSGKFLLSMKKRNMNVYGVEPGRYGFQICKSRGLNVQNTFLETSGYQDDSFDVITLNHVLEHLPNPKETLLHVRRLLRPSGTVIIQVPNLRSFAFLISRQYFFHLDVPRHLFHFTRETLESYLTSTGFVLVNARYYSSATAILESLWLRLRSAPVSTYDKTVAQRNRLALMVFELILVPFKVLLNKLHLGDSVEVYAVLRSAIRRA